MGAFHAVKRLLLFRHSPAVEWGILYGQTNVAVQHEPNDAAQQILSQLSEQERLSAYAVFCSPWERSLQPARIVAEELRLPLRVCDELSELNFGEWEQRSYSEIERLFPKEYANWLQNWRTVSPPGGESVLQLHARVQSWLSELPETEAPAIVVTHASVIRTLQEFAGVLEPWSSSVPHLQMVEWASS